MLIRGAPLIGAAAALVALVACGTVVETGPEATPGSGFTEVVVEAPATTAAPDVTEEPDPATTAPATPTTAATGAAGSTATTEPADALFPSGSCLNWDQSGASAGFDVVSCDLEHLAEVAGGADLSSTFPADAPYPTDDELRAVVSAACVPVVLEYLGRELGPGEEPGVISPNQDGWAQGERVVYCTVGLARQDGQRPAYTGSLKG